MRIKQPVLSLIREKLPVTIQLASLAIIIALVIGVGAGIVSAVKKDSIWDYVANGFALWGISTPNFWLRSEEHTSELQSLRHLVCRLLLEKKNRVPGTFSTPGFRSSNRTSPRARRGAVTVEL